ncbi:MULTISPECIES: hypothetical protein [Salegentibacter]|mgnify:CR=1 FL=1|uniref:Transcriptional regulator n=3 Tax=Salegentibacter TaxID=143222 RepID=A0A0Q9Z906_9FLAO|nr:MULTISPECIES: hypothetical protein [Salegentibacter]APS40175.1 hypothetical protein AO058_15380 [Salegentibacter sp. T436]KRG29453.1 hypothetical protein APR42_16385 [Salegentibacter mishustinae]PNW19313.1 hypothetical protein APB85_16965 [Salegentibacter mishustinae]PZX59946.1 hypothetical protein LY54_03382 [Salegentibacter mishustinae]GGW95385.1 hypothetical protein GCM10008086_25550 [Salegentibacter mishustinae]
MTPEISVPIQLFIDAQQKGYAKKLQFFLSLKLIYKCGKAKLDDGELLFLELTEEISSRKTTLKYIDFLVEKGWLQYNNRTGYYIIKSFERIRSENNWKLRLSYPVDFYSYRNIKAITGAIIYGYLHKDFWRKVRRKKSVQIKGSTYHFLSPNFNYIEAPAPLSVLGICRIFQISPSTASRLKEAAEKQKLLQVKKNYGASVPSKKAMELCLDYNDKRNNIVFYQGNYRFQLIDTILPLFLFKKRKKLKT